MTLKKFYIYGERCSGTNFLQKLVLENISDVSEARFFPWQKHAFVNPPFVRDDEFAIVITRNANDWFRSFQRTPHQVAPSIAGLKLPEFLRAEWRCVFNGRILAQKTRDLDLQPDQELLLERHPVDGSPIRNVIELRNLKLRSQLKVRALYKHHIYVRYEDLLKNNEGFINQLSEEFGLRRKSSEIIQITDDVSGKTRAFDRSGESAIPERETYSQMDKAFILSKLDLNVEAEYGYFYNTNFDLTV